SGGVGLSVIFIALANGFNTDLFGYLFGSVSAVSKGDFYLIIVITIIVLGTIFLFYKELLTLSFDEEYVFITGIYVKRIYLFYFYLIIVITIIVLYTIFLFYKELLTLSFDEEHAVTSGIHAKRIHFLFIILTALVIAASIRIVGVLLVSALMSLPVAAAMRL